MKWVPSCLLVLTVSVPASAGYRARYELPSSRQPVQIAATLDPDTVQFIDRATSEICQLFPSNADYVCAATPFAQDDTSYLLSRGPANALEAWVTDPTNGTIGQLRWDTEEYKYWDISSLTMPRALYIHDGPGGEEVWFTGYDGSGPPVVGMLDPATDVVFFWLLSNDVAEPGDALDAIVAITDNRVFFTSLGTHDSINKLDTTNHEVDVFRVGLVGTRQFAYSSYYDSLFMVSDPAGEIGVFAVSSFTYVAMSKSQTHFAPFASVSDGGTPFFLEDTGVGTSTPNIAVTALHTVSTGSVVSPTWDTAEHDSFTATKDIATAEVTGPSSASVTYPSLTYVNGSAFTTWSSLDHAGRISALNVDQAWVTETDGSFVSHVLF